MEGSTVGFTRFDSDDTDKAHGVWNMVFGNLADFDRTFASLKNPNTSPNVPNPFGPITLEISAEALTAGTDLAICLRSASVPDFDREAEGLTVEEIESLYYQSSSGYWNLKWTRTLQEEQAAGAFPGRAIVSSPEFSATFANGVLPLRYVLRATVQQLHHGGRALIDEVNAGGPYPFYVNGRTYYNAGQADRFDRLAALAWECRTEADQFEAGPAILAHLTADDEQSGFAQYVHTVLAAPTVRQLSRWGTYLNTGTLSAMET